MRNGVARRQSVARRGLETAPRAQVEGRAGFLCLRALALCDAAGLMAIGRPAGPLAASRGSGPLNCARHGGESWDFLAIMQAVTRSTLGISELQRRKASPVQACSCSGV